MVVVGGGLAGTALAYYLARDGVDVLVLERSELNREASGTNAGSFHFQIAIHQLTARDADGSHERLLADVRFTLEAARLWGTLETELDGSLDIHRTGGLMVAETPEELRLLHDKQAIEAEADSRPACSKEPSSAGSRRTSPRICSGRRTVRPKGMPTRSPSHRSSRSARSSARPRPDAGRGDRGRAGVRRQDECRRRSRAPVVNAAGPGPVSSPQRSVSRFRSGRSGCTST